MRQVRLRLHAFDQVKLGQVKFGQMRLGRVKLTQGKLDHGKLGRFDTAMQEGHN